MKELPQLLKTSTVPEALQQIAAKLLQNLPPRQQLNDSSGLKQATVNSGLFLEAKISDLKEAPGVTIDQDFKADLLKLVDVIKKEVANTGQSESQNQDLGALKNLQQKTENSIAKIILDQLTSLPKEDTPKQIWMFDIPFVDRGQADTVSIQITKDQENNQSSENEKDKWSVTLTMNPPGLGSIQCQLSYQNETINTYFRSQQTQTIELISDHVDHLKRQFEDAGLKPGVINIQQGLQPAKSIYQIAGNTLFDEQA
jgi:flagellar hook-length control protein FliK